MRTVWERMDSTEGGRFLVLLAVTLPLMALFDLLVRQVRHSSDAVAALLLLLFGVGGFRAGRWNGRPRTDPILTDPTENPRIRTTGPTVREELVFWGVIGLAALPLLIQRAAFPGSGPLLPVGLYLLLWFGYEFEKGRRGVTSRRRREGSSHA